VRPTTWRGSRFESDLPPQPPELQIVAVGLDDIVRRHRSPEDEEDVARVNRPLQPALSNTLLEGPQRLLPIALKYPDSGQAYKIPGTARRVSPPALAFAGNLTGQLLCPLGLPALLQRPGETEHAGDPEPRCFGQAPLEVMPRRVQITHSERMFARDDQRLRAMPDAPPRSRRRSFGPQRRRREDAPIRTPRSPLVREEPCRCCPGLGSCRARRRPHTVARYTTREGAIRYRTAPAWHRGSVQRTCHRAGRVIRVAGACTLPRQTLS
jgi:hypothetical protein